MAEKEYEVASLRNIAQGEAIAAFDFELKKAIENCMDINTEANAARTVSLKVKIKPNNDRNQAIISFQASSSLPPDAPGLDTLFLTTTNEGPTAFVHTPEQMTFEDYVQNEGANRSDVLKIQSQKAAANGGEIQ